MSYTSSGVLSLMGQPEAPVAATPTDNGGTLMEMLPILTSLGRGGPTPSRGGSGPGSLTNGAGGQWEQVARQMAARKYGWDNGDFRYVDWIIGGGGPNDVVAESRWNPKAVNPSSGAYGIPQILPSAHPDVHLQNNPRGQVRWLLNYIKQRYGSPKAAYAFKSREGWY